MQIDRMAEEHNDCPDEAGVVGVVRAEAAGVARAYPCTNFIHRVPNLIIKVSVTGRPVA